MSINKLFSRFSREKTSRVENDDYKVTRSRRTNIIVAIVSFVCAIIIWAVAVYVDSSSRAYTDVKIQIRNAQTATDAGYELRLSVDKISFLVTGRSSIISSMNDESVIAYVDLDDMESTPRAKVKVKFDSKFKLWYSDISNNEVYVTLIEGQSANEVD